MKWVTRQGAQTDRVACPWLIGKFIDRQAIAHGFAAICRHEHGTLDLEFPGYDARYAWCRAKASGRSL